MSQINNAINYLSTRKIIKDHNELKKSLIIARRKEWFRRILKATKVVLMNKIGFDLKSRYKTIFVKLCNLPKSDKKRLSNIPSSFITDYSIHPDVATILFETLLRISPFTAIECGCGISTIIGALAKEKSSSKYYSLEESSYWLNTTQNVLQKLDLENNVQLVHAPLTSISFNNKKYSAHDNKSLCDLKADLLFVDAPPANIGRAGVLIQMKKLLKADCLILLDDAARDCEQECVQLWIQNKLAKLIGYLPIGTGLAVLKNA